MGRGGAVDKGKMSAPKVSGYGPFTPNYYFLSIMFFLLMLIVNHFFIYFHHTVQYDGLRGAKRDFRCSPVLST
jgi:hypothetical protein